MEKAKARKITWSGEVVPAWLGLELQDLTPELAAHFGLAGQGGALVSEVMADSPAAEAGLGRGMVVRSRDGRPVNEVSDYGAALAEVQVGGQVPEVGQVHGDRSSSGKKGAGRVRRAPRWNVRCLIWRARNTWNAFRK